MSSNNDVTELLLLVVFFGVVVLLFYSLILAIPVAAAGFTGYMIYHWRHNSVTARERKAKEHTCQLYNQARAAIGTVSFPSGNDFAADIVERIPQTDYDLALIFGNDACDQYEQEGFAESAIPPPPPILDQCRKLRVGSVLAHQRLAQTSGPVLHALTGSTAIKFVTNVAGSEAKTMAHALNTTPYFITGQLKYSFAAHISGMTDTAISLSVPNVDFNAMPKMRDDEFHRPRSPSADGDQISASWG